MMPDFIFEREQERQRIDQLLTEVPPAEQESIIRRGLEGLEGVRSEPAAAS
jgi:DNA-directed RNA polymerase specialized sigma24 family protein